MTASVFAEIAFAIGCAARAAEIQEAIVGETIEALKAARIEQIGKHGHDAEHDAMLPIDQLPRLAQGRIVHALDQIQAFAGARNLPAARLNLLRGAAILLAAVDRLAPVIAAGMGSEGEEH